MASIDHATRLRRASLLSACSPLATLAACGGGAETTENPVTTPPRRRTTPGPAPATADVQAFKLNVWDNVKAGNRCGACHDARGQTPRFARNDDVNLAYAAANSVVKLDAPARLAAWCTRWPAATTAGSPSSRGLRRHPDHLDRNWAGSAASGGTQRSS